MQLMLTTAGRAAIVNGANTGTNAVTVSQIGLTSAAFTPSADLTALPGEIKRLSTFGGQAVADDTIHVTIRDESTDVYSLFGFGLYLSDGTLFATFGQATEIMEKASASMLLLAADTQFADISATAITFGSTDFMNPPATTTVQGVVELATSDETISGTDGTRAVTPLGFKAAIDSRFGSGAPSTFVKNLLSIATAAALRVAIGVKSAATFDTGSGNGLDADTLDGKHASDFAPAGSYAPLQHTHVISDVTGLQAALDDKMSGTIGMASTDFPAIGMHYSPSSDAAQFAWKDASGNYQSKGLATRDWVGSTANAASASKLATARTISFTGVATGSAGFDGSADVSIGLSMADGALSIAKTSGLSDSLAAKLPLAGGTMTGSLTTNGSIYGSGNSINLFYGPSNGYKLVLQADGNFVLYSGSTAFGQWQPTRFSTSAPASFTGGLSVTGSVSLPDASLTISDTSGLQSALDGKLSTSGNAASASKLATARTISFTGVATGGAGFDGSADVSIGLSMADGALSIAKTSGLSDSLAAKLPLAGGTMTGSLTTNGSIYGSGNSINLFYGPSNGYKLSLQNDGNFVFYYGTTVRAYLNPAGTFNVSGTISTGSGFSYGSSIKLKDIDAVMPYGLAEIDQLSTLIGRYKLDYNPDNRQRLFLSAEQVASLIPEAVDIHGVDYKGEKVPALKIEQLVPVIVRAIQELSTRIRCLEVAS